MLAVVALTVTLISPVASAQTVADIESRDSLIANQEALLNVYRCMFGVDTEIVPGGCADGKPTLPAAVPRPFTGTPTSEGLAARDSLIGSQEALLNVYRCLFDVDTEIVPGGCVAGRPYPAFTAQPPPGSYAYTAVVAGWWHNCALHDDGASGATNAVCWGFDGQGQLVPLGGQLTEVAGGGEHSCAIRSDQAIACWGWDGHGQSDAPEGAFTAVAAGFRHSCAIRDNQTIICWGDDEFGQADAPAGRYTAIAAGLEHSCAIRENQTIACWGNNRNRQSVAPRGRYREITAGSWHSCAIRLDWAINCWGYNYSGQANAPTGAFVKVAAGSEHSCALRNNGTIACWGQNEHGQIDAPKGRFAGITAANQHSCAIHHDHTIECWGDNEFGQAEPPSGLRRIQAIYAIPADADAVEGREQAIAHNVAQVQRWFRSQTGGKHPLFELDGTRIAVETVTMPLAASEYKATDFGLYGEIRGLAGAEGDTPVLIFFEGQLGDFGNCGWQGPNYVFIPIKNCDIEPVNGSTWPGGATYIIAHELTHLLGATQPCAPNHDDNSPSHTNDSNRDVLYSEADRDWNNLVLDYGNDDYYNHGRDDCYDIAHNPLLARE